MTLDIELSARDHSPLNLVGSWVEIRWTSTHSLAKRQCEKCVYQVRGAAGNLVCVELVYDAIDGVHRKDAIYWTGIESFQYLRVLTEAEAQRRIHALEREVLEHLPKD